MLTLSGWGLVFRASVASRVSFQSREIVLKTTLATFCALLLSASAASAVTIPQGGAVALGGTTTAAEPNLAGLIVEDSLDAFLLGSTTDGVSGNIQSRVVRSVDGTYDFYWRITDLVFAGQAPDIFSLRLGEFGPKMFTGNANYRTDGSGTRGPDEVFGFALSPALNGYANFNFTSSPLTDESYFVFIDTDAFSYARTGIIDISNGQFDQISNLVTTFAPGAIPEPGTWALMISGFGLIGAALRRRAAHAAA